MTYKEIINRIRTVAQSHLMIKDFGYGELSDIKTQAQLGPSGNIDDGKEADYPYMFLLQSNATRNDPVVNYNFSMIMMDMARGEEGDTYDNYLTIQSQCQQYIDDVLANLYYFYRDQPMVQLTGITYQPFKEKYQDEVAGMTANFTIQVPNGLNDCLAPIDSPWDWYLGPSGNNYGGYNDPNQPTQGNMFLGNTSTVGPYVASPRNWNNPNATQALVNSFTWGDPGLQGQASVPQVLSRIELDFELTYRNAYNPGQPLPANQIPIDNFFLGNFIDGDTPYVTIAPDVSNFPNQVSDLVEGQVHKVKLVWYDPDFSLGALPYYRFNIKMVGQTLPDGGDNPDNSLAFINNVILRTYT